MIGTSTTVKTYPAPVLKAVQKAKFKNLGHAAARIAKDMKESLQRAEGASEPGKPPHTHRGSYLKRAVRFDNDKQAEEAVIGPRASIVGTVGAAHEHGGEYKGQQYPERPFSFPALALSLDRLAPDWAGTVGV